MTPKLKGMTCQVMLEHFCYKGKNKPRLDTTLFLRHMILSKSRIVLALRFLNNMSIRQVEKMFRIFPHKSRFNFDFMVVDAQTLKAIFELIHPNQFEFAIGEDFDEEAVRKVLDYVKDTRCLRVDRNFPQVIPIVKEFKCDQFEKFVCQFELFTNVNFPKIKTKELELYTTSATLSNDKFGSIFKHEFVYLNLTDLHKNNWFDYRIKKLPGFSHQLQELKISYDLLDQLNIKVAPFINNLAKNLPTLRLVKLNIVDTTSDKQTKRLARHFNDVYSTIMRFYADISDFNGVLDVNYLLVVLVSSFEPNWFEELKKLVDNVKLEERPGCVFLLTIDRVINNLKMHIEIEVHPSEWGINTREPDEESDRDNISEGEVEE